MFPDLYRILGLPFDASDELILLTCHGKLRNRPQNGMFVLSYLGYQAAWYVLGDPARKAAYDAIISDAMIQRRARSEQELAKILRQEDDPDAERSALLAFFDHLRRILEAVAEDNGLELIHTEYGAIDYAATIEGFVSMSIENAQRRVAESTIPNADLLAHIVVPLNVGRAGAGARRSHVPGAKDVVIPASTWEAIKAFLGSRGVQLNV